MASSADLATLMLLLHDTDERQLSRFGVKVLGEVPVLGQAGELGVRAARVCLLAEGNTINVVFLRDRVYAFHGWEDNRAAVGGTGVLRGASSFGVFSCGHVESEGGNPFRQLLIALQPRHHHLLRLIQLGLALLPLREFEVPLCGGCQRPLQLTILLVCFFQLFLLRLLNLLFTFRQHIDYAFFLFSNLLIVSHGVEYALPGLEGL